MNTRDDSYQKETAGLLRMIRKFKNIHYEQALLLYPQNEIAVRAMIQDLISRNQIYFDARQNLLCDRAESVDTADYEMIAALWVLLGFKKSILYEINSGSPAKITFFAQDELYEIIYVPLERESLINHALSSVPENHVNRLIILETENQAAQISIPNTLAFCMVKDGTVSYYRKYD